MNKRVVCAVSSLALLFSIWFGLFFCSSQGIDDEALIFDADVVGAPKDPLFAH
jgi:hypothetical protein